MTETREHKNTRALVVGDLVTVLAPYVGAGSYGRDEYTDRTMKIVKVWGLTDAALCDPRLALPEHPSAYHDAEVWIHQSRLRLTSA